MNKNIVTFYQLYKNIGYSVTGYKCKHCGKYYSKTRSELANVHVCSTKKRKNIDTE